MTPWRKSSPNRKIIFATTMSELSKFIHEHQQRNWQPISEVLEINGHFEVLVELKDRAYVKREENNYVAN